MVTPRRRPGHVPLERALSKLGLCSRTQARALIEAGQVRVDGALKTNPSFQVVPEKARIEISGERAQASEWIYLLLHKPRGAVTTRSDEKGRATVFSSLPEPYRKPGLHLSAVGRLDRATSGLLFLTNDTQFSAWLTDPANAVPRTYLVSVRGEIDGSKLERLRAGTLDQGERLQAESIELRKASGKESHLIVTLAEGKNREIRRLFESAGHEVTKLKRVSYGSIELGDLEPGAVRSLSVEELKAAFPGYQKRGFSR